MPTCTATCSSRAAVPDLPFDAITHYTPLMLRKALEAGCRSEQGCDAITIPHNSNLSDGTMWDTADDPSAVPYMARYQLLAELIHEIRNPLGKVVFRGTAQ